MVREIIKTLFARVKVDKGTRDEVLDQCIAEMGKLIKDIKKSATALDLHKVDWLYHGMHELKLAKTLSKEQLAERMSALKDVQKYDKDIDDQMLASASLEAISIASKHIRSNI
jgi:hypothetical protein